MNGSYDACVFAHRAANSQQVHPEFSELSLIVIADVIDKVTGLLKDEGVDESVAHELRIVWEAKLNERGVYLRPPALQHQQHLHDAQITGIPMDPAAFVAAQKQQRRRSAAAQRKRKQQHDDSFLGDEESEVVEIVDPSLGRPTQHMPPPDTHAQDVVGWMGHPMQHLLAQQVPAKRSRGGPHAQIQELQQGALPPVQQILGGREFDKEELMLLQQQQQQQLYEQHQQQQQLYQQQQLHQQHQQQQLHQQHQQQQLYLHQQQQLYQPQQDQQLQQDQTYYLPAEQQHPHYRSLQRKQYDGANDDDEDDGSLLSDNDDDEVDQLIVDDSEDVANYVLCLYEKVERSKNKRKCSFRHGVMHLNGKDFVFNSCTGEFSW